MKEKRVCSKSSKCKVYRCPHHGEHTKTIFCDQNCDTFKEARCIEIR